MAGEKNLSKGDPEATRQMEEMWEKRHDPREREKEQLEKNRQERAERILKDAGLQ